MKIVVLGGSPKGDNSVTLQSVNFIAKKHPEHEFVTFHVAQRIGALEKDEARFAEVIEQVREADAVLWAFPLYVCLVCSQYKRFIELIFERHAEDAFRGKYTAAISTSIHFFDHTAHSYIRAICEDLGMSYAGGFPAHMQDLLDPVERAKLLQFAEGFFEAAEKHAPTTRWYAPLRHEPISYVPSGDAAPVDPGGRRVLILTDAREGQSNLQRMIEQMRAAFGGKAEVVNLCDIDIKGGCQGCCKCGLDNVCAYSGKDGYIDFYNTTLRPADIIVIAGAVADRHLSAKWRQFFDRAFFNTHKPTLIGKQIAFLISGPLGQLPDMRQVLETYFEIQRANVVDFVSDECADSGELDAQIDRLASHLVGCAEKGYIRPPTFLGVGGMKLLRDDVWGRLRMAFQADHKAYRSLGVYDFPQRDWRTRLRNAIVIPLTHIPRVREEFRNRMVEGMVQAHRKVVDEA